MSLQRKWNIWKAIMRGADVSGIVQYDWQHPHLTTRDRIYLTTTAMCMQHHSSTSLGSCESWLEGPTRCGGSLSQGRLCNQRSPSPWSQARNSPESLTACLRRTRPLQTIHTKDFMTKEKYPWPRRTHMGGLALLFGTTKTPWRNGYLKARSKAPRRRLYQRT